MAENESIDALSSAELINRAKAEEDESLRWNAVSALHRRGDRETLDRAVELLNSEESVDRILGADILGQLGTSTKPFLEERLAKLRELLRNESDAEVVASVAAALGHLGDQRGLDDLLDLAHHPSAEVRFAAAGALPTSLGDPEDERGIEALVDLSTDEDEDVRNWAVFGLGSQVDADSAVVRDALYGRIDDVHDETRDEALVGLARRGDERVVEPLLERLRSDEVGTLNVEAAREIGSPRLYEPLLNLRTWWDVDENLLSEAIERCQPERAE